MKHKILLAIQLFFFAHISATVQPSLAQVKDFASKVSWAFEENKGQVTGKDSAQVRYFYKQGNLTMFLMRDRLAYQFNKTIYPEGYQRQVKIDIMHHLEEKQLQDSLSKLIYQETYRMDIELVGANKNCEIIAEGKSRDYIQYYNHNALDVHAYQKITYKSIYPNIDWVVYQSSEASRQRSVVGSYTQNGSKNTDHLPQTTDHYIKYDFIVHPGGDPSRIKLRTHWVEDLSLMPDGSLVMKNRMGTVTEQKPISFQNGIPLSTEFKLEKELIYFQLPRYDTTKILVIDPSIVWSSYYGGSGDEGGYSYSAGITNCMSDYRGDIYLCGSTLSLNQIASGGHQNTRGGIASATYSDAFLVKFKPNGQRIWATYYGGSDNDRGKKCVVDKNNNVYLVGDAQSKNNIGFNGFQDTAYGVYSAEVFLVKFNSSGTRIWGTYIGGEGYDDNGNCVIDSLNNIYVVGSTRSATNINLNGFQSNLIGQGNFFIMKFDENCNKIWGTYFGGTGLDGGSASVSIEDPHYIYVTGSAITSFGLSTINITASPFIGNIIVKLRTSNGNRVWSSYFPGNISSSLVDENKCVYITGSTSNSNYISTSGVFQPSYGGGISDAFLVKIDSAGNLLWGTYYGGSGDDFFRNLALSKDSKYLYCVGGSNSNGLALNGFQNNFLNYTNSGGLIVKFDLAGNRIWSSYFDGDSAEKISGITLGKKGGLYISGVTKSLANISRNGHQNTIGGGWDAFLTKIGVVPKITIYRIPSDTVCESNVITYKLIDSNEGVNPKYQWYKNNILVGTDTQITITNIKKEDSVYCVLYSDHPDRSDDTVWSNRIFVPIRKSDSLHIYDTMCELQSYWFNNQNIYSLGLYRDTFSNLKGCDSFVFLHLLVKDTSLHEFTYVSPCDSVSYMFDGISRTLQGKYTAIDTNVLGCDSTTILNLFFRKPTHTRLSPVHICPNSSYLFDGIARTTAGDYIRYYSNADGCRSTDSLRISILSSPARQTNPILGCAPFTFEGKTYTSSITFKDTLKSTQGCDSVFRTNIIQLQPQATKAPDTNIIVCDSIRINNKLYTASFHLIDTFRTQGVTQCDSLYQKTNYIIRYTPQIGLKERDTFMRGAQITLRPFSTKNYLWSTGETTQSISFKLTEDRQFYLIAWNEEPCRDTAYISLVAEDLAIVGMPTGFSPNGEHSENRTLKPNVNGHLEYLHLMIFNRWGEKVYETFDTNPLGWNGIFKGQPAPAGLYGYVMEYRTLGVIYTRSGEVMLVR